MIGKIEPKGTLCMRQHAGKGEAAGIEYELCTGIASGSPVIRSSKTGKWFFLSWEDILNLAIEAGINDESPE